MAVYESLRYPFVLQYPADWAETDPEPGTTAAFTGDDATMVITELDLASLNLTDIALSEYADSTVIGLEALEFEIVRRREAETLSGLKIVVIEYTVAGTVHGKLFMYMHSGTILFSGNYVTSASNYPELEPIIDYSISTFNVTASR